MNLEIQSRKVLAVRQIGRCTKQSSAAVEKDPCWQFCVKPAILKDILNETG
jgi:hypothetical protein